MCRNIKQKLSLWTHILCTFSLISNGDWDIVPWSQEVSRVFCGKNAYSRVWKRVPWRSTKWCRRIWKGHQTDLRYHENISEGELLLLGQREETEGAVSGGACAKAWKWDRAIKAKEMQVVCCAWSSRWRGSNDFEQATQILWFFFFFLSGRKRA